MHVVAEIQAEIRKLKASLFFTRVSKYDKVSFCGSLQCYNVEVKLSGEQNVPGSQTIEVHPGFWVTGEQGHLLQGNKGTEI